MPRKILVVEDKLFMVRLIQHHLEKAGYRLIQARNQQEARDALAQQSPELVVMDDCGNNSGKPSSLISFKNQSTQNIPVIRMTDVPQDLEKNVTDAEVVLTKPFSPTQFIAEVKRLAHDSQ